MVRYFDVSLWRIIMTRHMTNSQTRDWRQMRDYPQIHDLRQICDCHIIRDCGQIRDWSCWSNSCWSKCLIMYRSRLGHRHHDVSQRFNPSIYRNKSVYIMQEICMYYYVFRGCLGRRWYSWMRHFLLYVHLFIQTIQATLTFRGNNQQFSRLHLLQWDYYTNEKGN